MDADVLIIGSGPAGLQAAIHSARRKVSTVLIGRISGSAAYGISVENYFGTAGKAKGIGLLMNGVRQAHSFGCEVLDMNVVSASREADGMFRVVAESGTEISARAVVLATGVSRNKLNVPGEAEFSNGKGVSYCVSCDCNFYKGRRVAVVGSESEAAIGAEIMTRYASETLWIAKSHDADPALEKKAEAAGAVRIESSVKEIRGDGLVKSVVLEDGTELPVDGVFIELGGRSSADLSMDLGAMPEIDDTLKVEKDCSVPGVPGLFACGDITGRPWQIGKAVGEGVIAGMSVAAYAARAKK